MKRLTFKPEFVGSVLSGTKTATFRFSLPRFKVGEVVAATTRADRTPAHLVRAVDGFCDLRILSITARNWREFDESDYARTHATPSFYADQNRGDTGWFIEFERVHAKKVYEFPDGANE